MNASDPAETLALLARAAARLASLTRKETPMARNAEKTIFEVPFDLPEDHPTGGTAGDGTHCARFFTRGAAETFARRHTYYGKPCRVPEGEKFPMRLVDRWAREGKICSSYE